MFSPTELEYFIEIAGTAHLSRAAERLGVTQPALSHCVKRMEESLGTPLLIRSKKGVKLTDAGNRLLREANQMKLQWKNLKQSILNEVEQPQGLIRLGCHSAVAQYTLPNFLPKFLASYPDIQIHLNHGLSRHMTEMVISDQLDVAIVVNPVRHDDLILKEFCTDEVTLWKSNGCLNSDLLILNPDLFQTQDILKRLSKRGLTFKRTIESTSLEVIAHLLHAKTGLAILPHRVIESLNGKGANKISSVKNAPVFKDRIYLAYKQTFRQTERGRVFLSAAVLK